MVATVLSQCSAACRWLAGTQLCLCQQCSRRSGRVHSSDQVQPKAPDSRQLGSSPLPACRAAQPAKTPSQTTSRPGVVHIKRHLEWPCSQPWLLRSDQRWQKHGLIGSAASHCVVGERHGRQRRPAKELCTCVAATCAGPAEWQPGEPLQVWLEQCCAIAGLPLVKSSACRNSPDNSAFHSLSKRRGSKSARADRCCSSQACLQVLMGCMQTPAEAIARTGHMAVREALQTAGLQLPQPRAMSSGQSLQSLEIQQRLQPWQRPQTRRSSRTLLALWQRREMPLFRWRSSQQRRAGLPQLKTPGRNPSAKAARLRRQAPASSSRSSSSTSSSSNSNSSSNSRGSSSSSQQGVPSTILSASHSLQMGSACTVGRTSDLQGTASSSCALTSRLRPLRSR